MKKIITLITIVYFTGCASINESPKYENIPSFEKIKLMNTVKLKDMLIQEFPKDKESIGKMNKEELHKYLINKSK